jgi:hypothetical protein
VVNRGKALPYEQATFLPLYGRNFYHRVFFGLFPWNKQLLCHEQQRATAHQLIEHCTKGMASRANGRPSPLGQPSNQKLLILGNGNLKDLLALGGETILSFTRVLRANPEAQAGSLSPLKLME